VSQRTHKCPIQPPGNVVRQSGNLLQKLLQNSSEQSLHDHSQKEIISNFNITDNIDNSMNTYIKTHDNNETNSTSSNDLIK
ncbi:hypothetical protein NL492_27175, partial [Klebsiella pneumoniae]|nr:hypothetical protein [Klebsiella pneumoniae]